MTALATIRLQLATIMRNYTYTDEHGNVHEVTQGAGGKWLNNQIVGHVGVPSAPAKPHGATMRMEELHRLTATDAFQNALLVPAHLQSTPAAGDPFLRTYLRDAVGSNPPHIVDRATMDHLVASGSPELWRGDAQPRFREDLLTGHYHVGIGLTGNGTYTAAGPSGKSVARRYAGPDGIISRMTVAADARLADGAHLEQERQQVLAHFVAEQQQHFSPGERVVMTSILSDLGRYAAIKGFDGFVVHGKGDDNAPFTYHVLLNRSKMIAQHDPYYYVPLSTNPQGISLTPPAARFVAPLQFRADVSGGAVSHYAACVMNALNTYPLAVADTLAIEVQRREKLRQALLAEATTATTPGDFSPWTQALVPIASTASLQRLRCHLAALRAV